MAVIITHAATDFSRTFENEDAVMTALSAGKLTEMIDKYGKDGKITITVQINA